jgi:GNAT superfamily N-acetyltransferase
MSARIESREPVFAVSQACFVYDIYINPLYQGQSIGRSFMAKLKQWTRSKHISHIMLEVSPRNTKGLQFWQSAGFHVFQHKMALKVR